MILTKIIYPKVWRRIKKVDGDLDIAKMKEQGYPEEAMNYFIDNDNSLTFGELLSNTINNWILEKMAEHPNVKIIDIKFQMTTVNMAEDYWHQEAALVIYEV